MNATRVSYTLDSSLESVNKAEETASDFATKSGFESEEVQRISMAVREAAVNAVLHGKSYDPRKKVHIAFETNQDALTITIRDEGKGLDPGEIPDPLAPEPGRVRRAPRLRSRRGARAPVLASRRR